MKQSIVYKNIKELKPYKKNAKKHPREQVERIAESIKQFGFTQPVLIDKDNVVIATYYVVEKLLIMCYSGNDWYFKGLAGNSSLCVNLELILA